MESQLRPMASTRPRWTRLIWNSPQLPPPELMASGRRVLSQCATRMACSCWAGVAPRSANATRMTSSTVHAPRANTRVRTARARARRDRVIIRGSLLSVLPLRRSWLDPGCGGQRQREGVDGTAVIGGGDADGPVTHRAGYGYAHRAQYSTERR